MGTTYLELTNRVLRKLNEIELTSANFSTATGFQALCKDLVQESIDKIHQASPRWPFLHAEATITCVADQSTYDIESGYRSVDWSTFYLQEDAALVVSADPIPYIDYLEWHNLFRNKEDTSTSNENTLPKAVYRTRDEKIGISPTPQRAYTITYEYWAVPARLVDHDDTTSIPVEYDNVIISHAMVGGYRFRENYEMAGVEYRTFEEGLKDMKKVLIPDRPKYAYDTRVARTYRTRRNK